APASRDALSLHDALPIVGHHHGTGTLRKRGNIWYVSYWVEGKQHQKSSHSTYIREAKKLRDQILGRKARGEVGNASIEKITCSRSEEHTSELQSRENLVC